MILWAIEKYCRKTEITSHLFYIFNFPFFKDKYFGNFSTKEQSDGITEAQYANLI
jgi:hypothetical protein